MTMPAWYWERERLRKKLNQLQAFHAPCNWPRGNPKRKCIMFCKHFTRLATLRAQLDSIKPEGADDVPRVSEGGASA